MDLSKVMSILSVAKDIGGAIATDWKGKAPASFDEFTGDVDKIIQGVMDPLKDGFQFTDLFAMKDPVMAAIMCATGAMDLPESSEDSAVLTKQSMAVMAYTRLIDNFDPDIDFTFPWWASWAEGWAEEAVDKVITSALRDLGPLVVEHVYALAAAKFPKILGQG